MRVLLLQRPLHSTGMILRMAIMMLLKMILIMANICGDYPIIIMNGRMVTSLIT